MTLLLTPKDNGKVLDLGSQIFSAPRKDNSPAIVFERGTKDITLRNFKVSKGRNIRVHGSGHIIEDAVLDTYGVGIFVESGAHHITISTNDIKAGAVGIYLEHGSHHNLVEHNTIHDCGYWADQARLPFRVPRMGWDRREGIAVDASTDNVIQYNTLRDNAFAGICLYRNCGEQGEPVRKQGANRNVIYGNEITGSKVEVWNAAREWRDMLMWDCSCGGEWVDLKDVPKQPYQQWFNWACLLTPLVIKEAKFRWPIRRKIWVVPDEAEDNVISS